MFCCARECRQTQVCRLTARLTPWRIVQKSVLVAAESAWRRTSMVPEVTMHILVIEDHDPMARTIEAILVADQHTVARAADGRAGMALFAQQHFDLVITDILMPNQEGLETIREMVSRN
ncbi:MAG: response regulator transcription factor, partial [Ferrovibrio sp.]